MDENASRPHRFHRRARGPGIFKIDFADLVAPARLKAEMHGIGARQRRRELRRKGCRCAQFAGDGADALKRGRAEGMAVQAQQYPVVQHLSRFAFDRPLLIERRAGLTDNIYQFSAGHQSALRLICAIYSAWEGMRLAKRWFSARTWSR